MRTTLGCLFALGLACGCGGDRAQRLAVRSLETPDAPGSSAPNLAVAPDGRVLLSWIEPSEEGRHRLRYSARPNGGTWSRPQTIAAGSGWFVNWADFPSLAALADGTLFAHWLAKSGAETYAYDVRVTASRDGGKTWSEPMTPHRDGTRTEHGFVSMAPLSAETMGLVWLDGRKTAGGEHHGAATAETSLYHGTLDRDGRLGAETVLDGRVCDCCQTDAAVADGAIVVVYRDRSDDEVRDVSVVRHVGGRWSEPTPLARDRWEINGCPVNGPAVAATGRLVAAAWFSAANEKPRVSVAFSADAGATFGPPIAVDDGRPLGRVDIALAEPRTALVIWLEETDRGAELRVRRVSPDGARGEALTVAGSSAARSSGFPRMAASGPEVILAWRDAAEPPRLRTALLTWGAPD